ncbi:unnamed protein product, partial [Polarella glacialis]
DLFAGLSGRPGAFALDFVELRAGKCFDLLAPGSPELRLREVGAGGLYAAEGAMKTFPETAEDLCAAMRAAHARRATCVTEANAVSSRSHAICTLRHLESGGCITLADCAGTERRKDSAHHSRERQQEGAEINASLHALKECVRFLAAGQQVPPHAYRASTLTKLLAGAFSRAGSSLMAVICTVSPSASDTEHTLSTLRTGAALRGPGQEREERHVLKSVSQPREPTPKQWTPDQVRSWMNGLENGL